MPSVNDKIVLEKYINLIKTVDDRYHIELPFKKADINVPDNYQYALNRMLKLEQRLKKSDKLHVNYFKFMDELFGSGHAIVFDQSEAECYGKIRYQLHFCINSSKKFRVVFDCSAKFKGMCVNNSLCKGPSMQNSLVGVLIRFCMYMHALISDICKLYY